EPCISHCEIRIETNGSLKQRYGCGVFSLKNQSSISEAVCFEGFEGWGRYIFRGSVVCLHRRQRFAELIANRSRYLPKRVEHVVLVNGLRLRTSERFAIRTVDRLQRQHILS